VDRCGRSGGELTGTAFLGRITAALAGYQPSLADRDPSCREAAVALALTVHGDRLDLLMLRRAIHEGDPWSGQIGLPGGRAEPGDASLLETAIRETREETGLDLSGARVLGALDELRPRTVHLPSILVRPYVFLIEGKPPVHPSEEVAELFWAPLGTLFDRASMLRTEVSARGMQMAVDAIGFEGRIIWGMTERILRSLQRLLPNEA
jgi:8-oxo-dGTP pyrophosphatase MutT (NUDIX family)